MICLYMSIEKGGMVFWSGLRSKSDLVAGSIVRTKAVKVSMIVLIQSNCTAERTEASWR